MAVALLSGSTLAAGQSMQSTCVYWLSTYTSVRFTGFATKLLLLLLLLQTGHAYRQVVVVVEIFVHGAVKATVTNAPQSQLNK